MNDIMKILPPIAALVFLLAAGTIFVIGFFRHGVNFIKYGFKQIALDSSLEKRFDKLEAKIGAIETRLEAKIGSVETRLETKIGAIETRLEAKIGAIEVNHFGHLKNYLGILNGVLLDKDIIDNETKARLDNELRGM